MRITKCDNCETILQEESNEVSCYFPTIYTITETPGQSPYTHNMTFYGQKQKSLVKHFCSERCIGKYYYNDTCECGTHKKGEHCHNISSLEF